MACDLLTDREVKAAKPSDKAKTLKDGNGLFVLIHPNGSKYFQLRTTLHGKPKLIQLGKYPDLSLAEARVEAKVLRVQVKSGIDPILERRKKAAGMAKDAANTFETVAAEWLRIKERTLAPSSYRKIIQSFNANVYPHLGKLPIKDIDSLIVRKAMKVMEARGALELMEKTRAWIRDVLNFALSEKLVDFNPIPPKDITLKKHSGTNHPTFNSRSDAGKFLIKLKKYNGHPATRIAINLQLLIATRPGELRLAEWTEFDLRKAIWTVPLERMKSRKHMDEPFQVMLSTQAVKALRELRDHTGHSKYLFPGNDPSRPISDMTIAKAIRSFWKEYRVVPHGFRHFFSTEANEHGSFRPDVIEAALSHKDGNAIRAVYNRATYKEERVQLAQWWADELDKMEEAARKIRLTVTSEQLEKLKEKPRTRSVTIEVARRKKALGAIQSVD